MELMKPTATLINISRGTIHNRTSQLPVRHPQRHAASTAQLAHAARTDRGGENSPLSPSVLFPLSERYLQMALRDTLIPNQVQ